MLLISMPVIIIYKSIDERLPVTVRLQKMNRKHTKFLHTKIPFGCHIGRKYSSYEDAQNIFFMCVVARVRHAAGPTLNDDATVPSELECVPLSEDCIPCLVSEFQEELSMENNGVELGSLS